MYPVFFRFFLIMLILAGCQTRQELPKPQYAPPAAPVVQKELIHKVALLVPLSGEHQQLGIAMRQAAEMSIFDLADRRLQLLPIDTKESVSGTKEAFDKAVSQKAEIILGPVFGRNIAAIKEEALRRKIPVISFSNDISLAQPGVYIFGLDVNEQVERVMAYASSKEVFDIFAILPDNAYGKLVHNVLLQMSQKRRINLVEAAFYNPEARNFDLVADKLLLRKAKGIFIPEGGKQLPLILASLKFKGIDLKEYQLLGTDQWDAPEVLQAENAAGGWFAGPSALDRGSFDRKYHESYSVAPHKLARLTYDAVSMAAMLVRMHEGEPFSVVNLTQRQGFTGVNGLFRLLSGGDTERSLAIFRISEGALQILDPAPAEFKLP